jgi:hypothetical protein
LFCSFKIKRRLTSLYKYKITNFKMNTFVQTLKGYSFEINYSKNIIFFYIA